MTRSVISSSGAATERDLDSESELSPERMRMLLDMIPALVSYVGPDRRYRYVNHAYEVWFGRGRSELVGASIEELLGSPADGNIRPFFEAALAGASVTFESVVPYRASTRQVRVCYIPERSADGAVQGVATMIMDRTEELRHEVGQRLLAKATQRLSASLDYEQTLQTITASPVPEFADLCPLHLLNDEGGAYLAAACHATRSAEYIRSLDRHWPLRLDEPSGPGQILRSGRPELTAKLARDTLRAESADAEHLVRLEELGLGSRLCVPLRRREQTIGALMLARGEHKPEYEPTDLRLAEELAERAGIALENSDMYRKARHALQKREEFLSIASHELKTPITTLQLRLQSFAAMVERGVLERDAALGALEKMGGQVQRLTLLVGELLDASRIAAGTLNVAPQPLDLAAFVREIVNGLAPEAQRKGSELRVSVPEELAGECDPKWIEQIVSNLVNNAIKFGQGAPIDVELRARGEHAVLRVRDRGIGIDPRDHARIFARFERAVSPSHYGGLGLGLWITKKIVHACQGTIEVESELDKGALFTVNFPRYWSARSSAP